MACGFAAWAFSESSLKIAIGVLVMLGLCYQSIEEWRRLGRLTLVVHEGGISLRNQAAQRNVLLFDEMVRLEARYVPGVWKKGLADEGNRVSLHVFTELEQISVPREMEGFEQLGKLLLEKTKLEETRVLVQTADAR